MAAQQRFIVIGSNSFSGSDFIDLLLEDEQNEVTGISRSAEKSALFLPYKNRQRANFKFFQLDLNRDLHRIIELVDSFQPHYVINFAAQSEVGPSWDNPTQWFLTNAVAITGLAYALKDRKFLRRYVHISSPEVYGTCTGSVFESAPLNPSTPYAASKAAGDLSLFTFFKHFNFPLVMIRSTNVYGSHQQLFKIIPRTVVYIKMDKTIELHGGGRAVKSYIHIRDISKGELMAARLGRIGEIYHLSPGKGISIKDAVQIICNKMGVDFARATRAVGERPGQDAAYIIDSTKARKELDWRPEISFDAGISAVVKWIEDNWDQIKDQPLEYIHKP